MRSWIFLLTFVTFVPFTFANDDGSAEDFYRGDNTTSGFDVVDEAAEEEQLPANVPVPTWRPKPPKRRRPSVIERPTSVQDLKDVKFTDTTSSDRRTVIFSQFADVFKKCSEGCSAGRAHCKGARGNRSCHPNGYALDLHGLVCDGVKYSAYTKKFVNFVKCVKEKHNRFTGELKGSQSRNWKVLYRRTDLADCKGAKPSHTKCNYNHAHFSLGCRVNGRLVW